MFITYIPLLRHLERRWGIEVMFRILKEQFGLGDCRCQGAQSLSRWVELVLLAYVLAGLTRWGKQLLREEPSWGEVQQEWGWILISLAEEVRGWLATLWRLLLWGLQILPPVSIPRLEPEATLTSWKTCVIDEELRNRLGAKARKFAEDNFWNWEERIEAEVAEVSKLIDQWEIGSTALVARGMKP